MPAKFCGEIYYTGYAIIIGDYIVSQFVGVTDEDFSKHIQSYNSQFRKFAINMTEYCYQKTLLRGLYPKFWNTKNYNLLTPHTNPYTTPYIAHYTTLYYSLCCSQYYCLSYSLN